MRWAVRVIYRVARERPGIPLTFTPPAQFDTIRRHVPYLRRIGREEYARLLP
jgi:hypothetical protein